MVSAVSSHLAVKTIYSLWKWNVWFKNPFHSKVSIILEFCLTSQFLPLQPKKTKRSNSLALGAFNKKKNKKLKNHNLQVRGYSILEWICWDPVRAFQKYGQSINFEIETQTLRSFNGLFYKFHCPKINLLWTKLNNEYQI